MLPFLSIFSLAQLPPIPPLTPPQQVIVQPQEIRRLPGHLDEIPVFNSNSPEVVYSAGVLLSTFPPEGKRFPNAHLNFPLQGRFDIFAHHIARGRTSEDWLPMYHGLIIHNPSPRPVRVRIFQGASYVTNPDAPFVELPPMVENPRGEYFSGPGSRLVGAILLGVDHEQFPDYLVIPPGETQILFNLLIRLGNARSTLVRLATDGPVYLASLAMPAIQVGSRSHREPTLEEWENLLNNGYLAYPRDGAPTPLDRPQNRRSGLVYGRVAGVARGSQWLTSITDGPNADHLTIPAPGRAFSYPISSVHGGTWGTGQIQSAPMMVRYPDTAYWAHGNYGVHYYLTLPLKNNSDRHQRVIITLSTPIKQDEAMDSLEYLNPPDDNIFFRGSVRLRYTDNRGVPRDRLIHLVQRRGQEGKPILSLDFKPGSVREIKIDFLYPPDATPPQALTVRTLEGSVVGFSE